MKKKQFLIVSLFSLLGLFQASAQSPTTFDHFPWLVDLIDRNNCTTEKVEVFEQSVHNFVLVTAANGSAKLYYQDGTFYCQHSATYDCVAAYNLGAPLPNLTWTCGSDTYEDCLRNCIGTQAIVCGVDGITYSNACAAICAGVEIAFNGSCNMECSGENPFSLPAIQTAINTPPRTNDDGSICWYIKQIIQFQFEGKIFYRIVEGANPSQQCVVEWGTRFYTCEGELIGGTGIYPACDDAAVCVYDIFTLSEAARSSGIIIWDSGIGQDCLSDEEVIQKVRALEFGFPACKVDKIFKIEYNGNIFYEYTPGGTCPIADFVSQVVDCRGELADVCPGDNPAVCIARDGGEITEIWSAERNCLSEEEIIQQLRALEYGPACGVVRITKTEYNGNSYYSYDIGTKNPLIGAPCELQDFGGATVDCEGNAICASSAFPINPIFCIELDKGVDTEIWSLDEEGDCLTEAEFIQRRSEFEFLDCKVTRIDKIEYNGDLFYEYFLGVTEICVVDYIGLVDCRGQIPCGRNGASPLCTNLNLGVRTEIWSIKDNNNLPIFTTYPWLLGEINQYGCNVIDVFDKGSYEFVFLHLGPSRGRLYLDNGAFYCETTPTYDCLSAYGLGSATSTFSCANLDMEESKERSGISSVQLDFKAFPNPTIDRLTIQLPTSSTNDFELYVHDMLGRRMYQKEVDQTATSVEVDMGTFEDGVYYIELRAAGMRGIQKVVKQELE